MPPRRPSTATILHMADLDAIARELQDLDREEEKIGARLLAIDARRKVLERERKRMTRK